MISSGVVEGFSGKAKLTGRKAYGSRTPQGIEIALFHVTWYPTRADNILQILLRRQFSTCCFDTMESCRHKEEESWL